MIKNDTLEREKKIEELREEIERLRDRFDRSLKEQGLSEEVLLKLDLDNAPPEVKKRLEESKLDAERAVEDRRAEAKANKEPPKVAFKTRKGAIKL
jgi:hypothetical protein